jgi:hypothetical protein
VELRRENIVIPDGDGWGTLYLCKFAPAVGREWTDTGTRRESRQLKHRAVEEVRLVPCAPPLGRLLRSHISKFGVTADGRLIRGAGGGDLSESVYGRIWDSARKQVAE